MKDLDKIKIAFIGCFTAIHTKLGILAYPFYILVMVNVLDYVTGIMAAARRGEKISSSVGFWGIVKKVCMWLLVLVGWVIDFILQTVAQTIHLEVEFTSFVAFIVIFWLMANELISILENIHDVGVDYPKPMLHILEYVKEKTEEAVDITDEKQEHKEELKE
ncbi:MAG: phage holin family protein [Oscillospiraceae bacterium]|nr:phage holin family protein [Oscillospiraceae bacterium]